MSRLKLFRSDLSLLLVLAAVGFASDARAQTETPDETPPTEPGESSESHAESESAGTKTPREGALDALSATPPKGPLDEDTDLGAQSGEEDADDAEASQGDEVTKPEANADDADQEENNEEKKSKAASFFERFKLSGYTQLRYNGIPTPRSNPDLINHQGDRSIGGGNGFAIRRARLVLAADLHQHVAFYFQVDVVSMAGGTMHTLSLRDLYFDLYFDKKREFRVRPGQSKVPFGFENLQSSSQRLALDRNDALNSAVKDERDLGVFFYYTPRKTQAVHAEIKEKRLKGTGDYGLVALGVYNGQTANQPELDGNFHVIGRVAYPFRLRSQLLEVSGGAYWGRFTVRTEDQGGTMYRLEDDDASIVDTRGYLAFILYPQPFGIQFEGNLGKGPSQGPRGEDDRTLIRSRQLIGGAAQIMYKIDEPFGTVSIIPFLRAAYYDGGKKSTVNAPHYLIKELEIGVEWQIIKQIELTLAYDIVERTSDLYPYDQQSGHVARVQLQVNYP